MPNQFQILGVLLLGLLLFKGCDKAPKYVKPSTATPPAFKELPPEYFKETKDWKFARPNDAVMRGNWWEVFNDTQLNNLEEQVNQANQNIALADANFRTARALVREARADLFPTVTTSPSIILSRQSGAATHSNVSPGRQSVNYTFPVDATWEPDFWHRIRNNVIANASEAQATAADLQNVRLSVEAELAFDYYTLRSVDAERRLLDTTIVAFQQQLDLTRVRFQTGIASDEDVAQAETQLATTQAQATDLGIERAQLEHAIAILIGQAPATFSIPVAPLDAQPPAVPIGLPSQLLERRPDVAAAERRVAEANADIGVAKAAFYPSLTLGATGGFERARRSRVGSRGRRVSSRLDQR